MKILSFAARRLHGYLSFKLKFNTELTFLTGINGSGKTSAVRALTALLTPSLLQLSELRYEQISVSVGHEEKNLEISALQTEKEFTVCFSSNGVKTEPLSIPVLQQMPWETLVQYEDRKKAFYAEQVTLHAEHPFFKEVRDLPTPMFLDLDRRGQESGRLRRAALRFSSRSDRHVNPLGGSIAESLSSARELAEDSYRDFLASRSNATDRLKQELILFPFDVGVSTDELDIWGRRDEFFERLTRTERLVIQSLKDIGLPEAKIEDTVTPFFARVRETAQKISPEIFHRGRSISPDQIAVLQEWSALEPRIQQINAMAERLSRYNRFIGAAFSKIDTYLGSVNGFLVDGSKRLKFNRRGNLHVSIDGDGQDRDISALSSGERQIVVILTHLAFNTQAHRANVLIIDEPELSLHLRWQELFVDAVLSASPGIQLILATHSPSIIKGRLADCIDVREEWRDASLFF